MSTNNPLLCYLEVRMRYDLSYLHKGYLIVPVQVVDQPGFRVCVYVPNLTNQNLEDDGDRYLPTHEDAIYLGMQLIERDIARVQEAN